MKKVKIILSSVFFLSFVNTSFAQLIVQDGLSAEEMATSITGTGVTILNPQVTGAEGSFGGFEAIGIPDFNLQNGVLLTTGKIVDAIGPNLAENTSTSHPSSISSPILEAITDSLVTKDACKLEFDIIPDGDSLRFNFSFASEEYKEFVCTPYDDIFGFFISGPGIVGDPGMPGGRKNIALIPGTATPVTINNVNSGNPTSDEPCPANNAIYHVENPLSAISAIQYDGWTTDIMAIAAGLIPCETYHLELIIADVNDRLYDSGVFIERIESNNVQVAINTVGATETMIEGCNDGIIEFCANEPVASDLTLEFLLQGTAVNGVDYDQIGDADPSVVKQVLIPAGNSCAVININTIDDGIDEGEEYVDIILLNPICDGLVTDSVRAYISDTLAVTITGDNAICSGESVFLSVEGDANTFQWGPSSIDFIPSEDVSNPIVTLEETTTITVSTTVAGCVATDEFVIEVADFDLDYTFVPDGCSPATCDGSISLEVTGGIEPYSFDWGTGDTTSSITGVCAGTYTISVIDASGCTKRDTVELDLGDEMTVLLSALEYNGGYNISCNGQADGVITAITSGGVGTYTYQWDDPSNSTTSSISEVGAGTYTVTVTDDLGCVVIESITLTEPPALELMLVSQTDVECGGNTGAIEISGSGGTPNYTYVWTLEGDIVGSGTSISDLGAGMYTVTMTDQNNCVAMLIVEITEPVDLLSGSIESTDVTCIGADDGTVTASGQGGYIGDTGSYQYVWLDDASTNPFRDDLTPGLYQVEITDDNSCTVVVSVNITEPDMPLSVNILNQQDITCSGSCAAVEVVGQGGTPGYSYIWNTIPIGPVPFSTASALEICSPGDYQVTVTDANGCTTTENISIVIVSAPMSINATVTNVACDGGSSGGIDVTVNGGVTPYASYLWTSDCGAGPFFTEDITDLCSGQWTLLVTDAVGCMKEFSLTVSEESDISFGFVMTPTLCVDDFSGALDITPVGGVGNYYYAWFGPASVIGGVFDLTDTIATTQDISGQGKGEYLVSITDDNGCQYLQEMLISAPAAIEISLDDMSDYNGYGVSCNNSCNGFVNVSVSGGTTVPEGDYSFQWSDQDQGFEINTSGVGAEDINGLCASQDDTGYQLIVVDDNNCIQNAFFEITEPDPIMISLISDSEPSCDGANDGTITASVTGGVPGYSLAWREGSDISSPVISTDLILEDVGAGEYCLTVTDLNDCSLTQCITIENPEALTVSLSFVDQGNGLAISCFGGSDGIILSDVSGGDGDYFYSWSVCGITPFQEGSVSSVSGLTVGAYCLTVTDGNGCEGTANINLISPTAITENAVVQDISCSGGNGAITLNLTGGSGVYPIIDWTPNGFIPDGSQSGAGLPAGNYHVDVVDDNGCDASFDFEIGGSEPINVTLTSPQFDNGFNVSCNDACDATLVANITGGSGSPTITWTGPSPVGGATGDVTEFNGNVCAGVYTVNISDGVCTGTDMITITQPEEIFIDQELIQAISCAGACDGQLGAVASGGGGGFTYQWTDQAPGPITEANLCAGFQCVTATDINGCSKLQCFVLNEPEPITVVLTSDEISCNQACDGGLTVNVSGGTGGYDYLWTGPGEFVDSVATISDLCPGFYEVTVTDENGCSEQASYNLIEPEAIELDITVSDYNGNSISCNGECDGWINVDYLGVGTADYSWTGPIALPPVNNVADLCEGTYVLTTTTGGVCVRMDTIVITAPEEIVVTLTSPVFPGGTNISCVGDPSGSIISEVTGGFGDFEYYWIQGTDTLAVGITEIDGLVAGTYSVSVVDENGCETTAEITLTEPDEPFSVTLDMDVYPNGANTSCSNICDGAISSTVSNGIGEIDYVWSGPSIEDTDTGGDVDGLCGGEYVLVVTDENQCVFAASETVVAAPDLEITADVVGIACFGQDTASIDITVVGGFPDVIYEWTGDISSNNEDISNLSAGTYNLLITDGFGCTDSQEFIITQPDTIFVTLDASEYISAPGFNVSGPLQYDGVISSTVAGGITPYIYSWNGLGIHGDEVLEIGPTFLDSLSGGEYCLKITDVNGCVAGACIELLEPLELHLPNGMSPNGDGMNDGLIVEGLELYPENLVRVFNRWGNIVFEQKNYSNDDTWKGDGVGGNFVPDGTYFVIVTIDDSEKELHGYLEVRR